jgi:hypothetical protein
MQLPLSIARLTQQFCLVLHIPNLLPVLLSLVRHPCCQHSNFSCSVLQFRKLLFQIR